MYFIKSFHRVFPNCGADIDLWQDADDHRDFPGDIPRHHRARYRLPLPPEGARRGEQAPPHGTHERIGRVRGRVKITVVSRSSS